MADMENRLKPIVVMIAKGIPSGNCCYVNKKLAFYQCNTLSTIARNRLQPVFSISRGIHSTDENP
jgi:hypothetical protein